MTFTQTLSRTLSLGKSKDKSRDSRTRPSLGRPQATASALHRTIHKSTFLYGRQSPATAIGLKPEQILELTRLLSQPVGTPLLTSNIANLKRPLSRPAMSGASESLCEVHSWFEPRWIEELTAVISEEIGPRLDSLRKAPRQLRSPETEQTLKLLGGYAHMFPTAYPDSSRTKHPHQCVAHRCDFCSVITCLACKLSQVFQNSEVLAALNVCVKGRKKRGKPWPEACAWLDPNPGCGWEMRWKLEGLPIQGDRIIVQKFRKLGGQERLLEAMASMQSEVLANKEAVRHSVASGLATGDAIDDIMDRRWSVYPNPLASSETVNLIHKMGLDEDVGDEQANGERWDQAYNNLDRESTRNSWASSRLGEQVEQGSQSSRPSFIPSSDVASSSVSSRTPGKSDSFLSSKTTLTSTVSSMPTSYTFRGKEGEERIGRTSTFSSRQKVNDTQSRRSSRADSWASSSTAESNTILGNRESQASNWPLRKEPGNNGEHVQLPNTTPWVQSIYPQGGQEQLGVHNNYSVESWANFNNSPLGKGHAMQSKQSVNELAGGQRMQSWHASHASYSASINRT